MIAHSKQPTILICKPEDDTDRSIEALLNAKNIFVHCISDSGRAIDHILEHVPELVLLDTALPVIGGYEVCAAIRPTYTGPILIQGYDSDEAAQLLAFERGADDYVALPVSPVLLTARICAHLKRCLVSVAQTGDRLLQAGPLRIDPTRREVSLSGEPLGLTTIQFDLLWYLAKRPGRVISRKELYKALFNAQYKGFDRAVDVYISRLRRLLGDDEGNHQFIKTVRGVGYLFAPPLSDFTNPRASV